jgi:hypothetical protein
VRILTENFSALVQELRSVIQDLSAGKLVRQEDIYSQRRDLPKPFPLDIPPSPLELDQADYPDAKYWTLKRWQKHTDKANGDTNSSKLAFLCDEDGNLVSKDRIKVMADTARKLWSDLYRHRYDPVTWRYVGKAADEYFTNNMRIAFPEFGLCAENWKVKMFATVRYPDWSIGSRGSGKLTSLIPFLLSSPMLMLVLLGAVPSINNNNTSISRKRVQEHDKENDSEGGSSRDKRPRLQQAAPVDSDSDPPTRAAPYNPKPSSTSKSANRPRPQPRPKTQNNEALNTNNLVAAYSPTVPTLAPVTNALRIEESTTTTSTTSTTSTGSVAVAMHIPAVPPAPILSLTPVATTSAQLVGPPDIPIGAEPSTIAATIATSQEPVARAASQTRELHAETRMGPIAAIASESAPGEEKDECGSTDGPTVTEGTLLVSIITFILIFLSTTCTRTTTT